MQKARNELLTRSAWQLRVQQLTYKGNTILICERWTPNESTKWTKGITYDKETLNRRGDEANTDMPNLGKLQLSHEHDEIHGTVQL